MDCDVKKGKWHGRSGDVEQARIGQRGAACALRSILGSHFEHIALYSLCVFHRNMDEVPAKQYTAGDDQYLIGMSVGALDRVCFIFFPSYDEGRLAPHRFAYLLSWPRKRHIQTIFYLTFAL